MPLPATDADIADVIVAWPLSAEQRTLVSRLAELVQRHGAARFTKAHLVRADERDFPDEWEPTLASLYRLIYRLFWHAHIAAEIEVEDHRGEPGRTMLTNSSVDFLEVVDGRAVFQVAAFGNDDIAGLVSHTVGEAFLALSAKTNAPFREAPPDEAASLTEASLAACFLGLGALVANSSMYRRYQSRMVGREVQSESRIEYAGGLSIADATLILAIQLTVRDDVPDAVETLHGPQREWIEQWMEVLDPHEDELRRMLGLDDADDELPARGDAPRQPAATIVEPAPPGRNEGLLSFRVPVRRTRFWLGLGLGLLGAIVLRVMFGENMMLFLLFPIGGIGGFLVGRPGFKCHACGQVMATELPTCTNCKVTLEDTLRTRAEVKARLARFAAEREAADAEHAAEAEAAYHPDV